MDTILKELTEQKNVRSNLSTLRQLAKEEEGKANIRQFFYENQQLVEVFLCSEDAKTRKNMALLLGDLEQSEAVEQLYANPALLKRMAESGRKMVEELFDVKKVNQTIAETMRLLNEES